LVWLGDIPVILIGPSGHELGLAEKFLKRYGPGVHSLAWEITDMWALEHRLRDRDIGITGVSVEGRHFFMHPRDTHGLLIEWCDGPMGAPPKPTGAGVVSVESLAWVSGVVADADETAAFLGELAVVKPASDLPAGVADQERTVDLEIGPIAVRLVTPTSPDSRYAPMIERGARWGNAAFRVADLDATLDALAGAGIPTLARDGAHAVTDPASTLGITFEWAS
ncbi:MAG TPA: hypothetical protein VFZ17_09285, partial [Acidimicrobiia bacterium]|nr:hypothetical protein [Acidimicrobiia bacterium]